MSADAKKIEAALNDMLPVTLNGFRGAAAGVEAIIKLGATMNAMCAALPESALSAVIQPSGPELVAAIDRLVALTESATEQLRVLSGNIWARCPWDEKRI